MTIARTIGRGAIGSPLEIPGCQLWLDAADASTITLVSGKVSQWNDKSGNGFNVSQTSAGKRPTYETAAQNGKAVVRYLAANATELIADNLALLTNTAGYSLFAVYKNSNTAAYTAAIDVTVWSPVTVRAQLGTYITTGNYQYYTQRATTDTCSGFSSSVSAAGFHVAAGISDWSVPSATLYINGVSAATPTGSTSGSTTSGVASIQVGSTTLTGDIGEIIIYGSALPAATRIRIENYLRQKWGTG